MGTGSGRTKRLTSRRREGAPRAPAVFELRPIGGSSARRAAARQLAAAAGDATAKSASSVTPKQGAHPTMRRPGQREEKKT